jgi:hypothetical protein
LDPHRLGDNFFSLRFTNDVYIYFSNITNEVLRGFAVVDFERAVNGSKESIQKLWHKLSSNIDSADRITLSAAEIRSLSCATRICYKEFGDEEFSTRVGVSAEEALKQVDELEQLLR